MTPDLPGHLLRSVLLSMEASGHDTPALIRRLRPNVLTAARTRVSWDELVLVLETFFSQHGVSATQSVMQDLASRHSSPFEIGVRPKPMAMAGPSGQ